LAAVSRMWVDRMVKSVEIEKVDNGYIVTLKGGASFHGIAVPSKRVYVTFRNVVKDLGDYFGEKTFE